MEKIKDRVAIVTEAGGGIGPATARPLAQNAEEIVVTDVIPESKKVASDIKRGVLGFTRSICLALAPHGITVNAIASGEIDSGGPQRVATKEKLVIAQERRSL